MSVLQRPAMELPLIATTTVGSFPRPTWLAERNRSEVKFRLQEPFLSEALDDATLLALQLQEEIGLDLITDGEQRRPHFINHVLACWDGVDVVKLGKKAQYRGRMEERLLPRIVGKVTRRSAAVLADLRFAQAHSRSLVKMAVPGPMTVVDSTADETYGDEEAFAMDVAAAINAELLDLQEAGCHVVQIDEPAMTRYQEKVAAYGARALERCIEGIRIPAIVHLCYGYPGGGERQHQHGYPELLKPLMKTKIGGFSVEFARSNYDPAVLSICSGRLVVFGCVDPSDTPLPPISAVVDRVRAALKYVEPSKLLLAPDCGLMTINRDLAREKAALLVEIAKEARRSL